MTALDLERVETRLTELFISESERPPILDALAQGWLVVVKPLSGIRVVQCVDPVTKLVYSKPIV